MKRNNQFCRLAALGTAITLGIAIAPRIQQAVAQAPEVQAPEAQAPEAQEQEERLDRNVAPAKADGVAESQPLDDILLAQQLIDYGQQNQDAMALVTAARILLDNPAQAGEFESIEAADAPEAIEDKAESSSPVLDPETVLALAREIAGDDADLLSLIEMEQGRVGNSGGTRGRVGGPTYHEDRVLAYSRDSYRLTFRSNSAARIGVSGDGDTDLDCYLYDENGSLILYDEGYSDECRLSWTPRWTGNYRLEIRNLGGVYNNYVLLTN
ncbi:hypothetical protein IQ241_21745 [Romeria aff. gracilis LEGE 07310]|uniref:Peptidase C-terminal archaeal/bacterial domain-containing protein n=1 Tax=Vasconcelosia minhoensis LEGE 07310 TaxID=915328 RepID=A0A8J7AVB9_9CYAN|nr:hypothetical protein [Romeria gracilis]MBE9079884.1 hypothetical protein [Romeria aff. gracilis LEGE 07310]